MSADRYEITDDGTSIIIAESSGIRSTIDPVDGHHLDDAVIGAIRQQARDIAELRADYVLKCTEYNDTTEFARGLIAERDELRGEIARHERNNTHIGKMFDQLRADLAAAVAITATRDETIAELELRLRISRQSNKELRESAEQAEARLAAIDNAPTVAVVCSSHCFGQFVQQRFFGSQLPRIGTELIARPAKD